MPSCSSRRVVPRCSVGSKKPLQPSSEAIDNCYLVGLQASLARLEPALAGRPEPWDWDAFAVAQAHYADLGLAAPVDAS